ncbi:hypothetical protein JCM33374_g6644 [Metschnikowia sp. JCM 33374]|nr:hypothetical protein JCM33374_g6644 [Metschnikowia sp. JCM 33374]
MPPKPTALKTHKRRLPDLCRCLKMFMQVTLQGFLLGVLQECHDHMPLDEFYCMLYSDYLKDRRTPNGAGPKNTEHLSRERLKATKLYSLILESFKKPETFQNGLLRNSLLYNVNFHEVQRNFLAMKILFGCIKQVDESSKILPRVSIYKLYYILCQRLLKNHPLSTSFSFDARENLVLGQSKIGILTKMIHPGLVYKRLGKRGMSITHYIGVTWNESMIDEEITGLLNLDIPKLREHFKTPAQDAHEPAVRSGSANPEATNKPDRISSPTKRTSLVSSKKPLYSFVDLSCKYPDEDCSPRLWRVTPSSVPKQSGWAKELTQKSVRVLKEHGVDLNPVVAKVNAGNYSDDDHSKLYLHLYLVVLLLLLPLIVASDEEFASVSKAQLRTSVKEFAVKLENEVAPNSSIDKTSLTIFTRILRKMIHISELTSSSVKSSPTESVLKEMDHDIKSLTTTSDDTGDISPFQEIFIKGCMSALNAYKYNVSDLRDGNGQEGNLRTLINIGKSFQDVSLFITHTLQEIPLGHQECDDSNDLPFQVFHLSAKFFHEVTLALPEFSQLPIPIITFIILYYTNEMQQVSFAKFARRGPDLSKETFKCWWVRFVNVARVYVCDLGSGCLESGVGLIFSGVVEIEL